MIHEQLPARNIPREAAHPIIHRDDIRIEIADQIIECLQRRNRAAGRHIDIDAERRDARIRMELRIGMHGHMALIQMRQDRIPHRPLNRPFRALHGSLRRRGFLRNEQRHARPLWIIILLGDIEDLGTDHLRHPGKDLCESLRIVL